MVRNIWVTEKPLGWTAAWLVMGVFLAVFVGNSHAGQVKSKLDIHATVIPNLQYEILHEAASLNISKKDIGHGNSNSSNSNNSDDNSRDDDSQSNANGNANSGRHKAKAGHKKVKNGTIISVTSNNPAGYVLIIQAQASDVFSSVRVKVKGAGANVDLAAGGSVEMPIAYNGNNPDIKKLSYDFTLRPDIEAGVYPWPIYVTAYSM